MQDWDDFLRHSQKQWFTVY